MKKLLNFLALFLVSIFLTCGCKQNHNPKILTYSTWGSHSEMQIIKTLIKEFEEKNDVKIKIIHVPQNYFQKLHLLFASNKAPDVVFINNYYLPLYAKANLLEKLDKDKIQSYNYFENTLKAMSVNHDLYAVPRDISNMVVYYNKSIFLKKNVQFPDPKWTYDDFLKKAKKLTDSKNFGIGFEENILFWEPILWAYGGEIFDNNGELSLNSQESLAALKFYIELKNKEKVAPDKMQSANRTMAQMFLDEKIAMQISGRWLVPKYRKEAKFDWDIVPLPNGTHGSITGSDTSGWAISKQSKNKKLALDLILYLSSYNSINKITETGLITPARKDSANSNSFLNNEKPHNAKVFLEINKNAKVTNIPINYNEKIEKLTKELEPYFLGTEIIRPNTKFEL